MGRELNRPAIVGHRANSLRRLLRYVLDEIDFIEIDVQYDGMMKQHIVRHPPEEIWKISTTYNRPGWLSKLYSTLYIRGYIPLEGFLDIVSTHLRGNIKGIMLDIKTPAKDDELERSLEEYIEQFQIYITSKNHMIIESLNLNNIEKLVTLTERLYKPWIYLSQLDIDGVSIDHRILDSEYLDELRELDLDIAIWTVNEMPSLEKLLRKDIDMIISDIPGKVRYIAQRMVDGAEIDRK